MTTPSNQTTPEQTAIRQVKALRAYYLQLITYICVIFVLGVLNFMVFTGFWWVLFPAIGWGSALLIQAFCLFSPFAFLGAEWEQKEIEKRMNKVQSR